MVKVWTSTVSTNWATTSNWGPTPIKIPSEWVNFYNNCKLPGQFQRAWLQEILGFDSMFGPCKHWPKFARKFIHKLKEWYKIHSKDYQEACQDPESEVGSCPIFYTEAGAMPICLFYADSQPRKALPLLIGLSPIMDKVIEQILRESSAHKMLDKIKGGMKC